MMKSGAGWKNPEQVYYVLKNVYKASTIRLKAERVPDASLATVGRLETPGLSCTVPYAAT